MSFPRIGAKFEVQLSDDCRANGGSGEYPNGWVGTEAAPRLDRDKDETDREYRLRIEESYRTSGPVVQENLRYLRFDKPFIGKDDRSRPTRKTDTRNAMWVPSWQLAPVPEPEAKIFNTATLFVEGLVLDATR